jgi:hypothetical protein
MRVSPISPGLSRSHSFRWFRYRRLWSRPDPIAFDFEVKRGVVDL